MKEILKPKSKALTEKDCYEELTRIIKIYCYQAVVREEIDFFRWWVNNVLTQLSEYASSPDEPEKYPAYKELRRKASEFVREPAEDPSRVMIQRTELKAALENAEVGMSWNGVKYAVSALIRYGFIKKEDGKLSVNPSSPEVMVN